MSRYQNLDAWKISMQLVKETCLLTRSCTHDDIYGLTSGSTKSITPAFPLLSKGMRSKKGVIQLLHVSRHSLYETETLLDITMITEMINNKNSTEILLLLDQSMLCLNWLINYLRRKDLNK